MPPTSTAAKARASRACVFCHRKKIRCDIANSHPCSGCRTSKRECLPRERKRRRNTLDPSSPSYASPVPDSLSINHVSNALSQPRQQLFDTSTQDKRNQPAEATYAGNARPELSQIAEPSTFPQYHGTQSQPYLGRSEYMGPDFPIDERLAQNYVVRPTTYAALDKMVLEQQQAFELPPRLIQNSLIDSFYRNCSTWMPVIDPVELEETPEWKPSILLRQAVFLAGSRMCSSPLEYTSCEDLYRRTKALFFAQCEKDMITVIKALCLIQWWNPTGPEHVSLDKGSFWLRISIGLAFDIGLHRDPGFGSDASLRRRLWWTIYSRDCLISAGQGRPRAINPKDCDVRPISVDDFPATNKSASLFVAYVQVCSILGDITQCCLRNNLSLSRKALLERDLRHWVQALQPSFQLYEQYPAKRPAAYHMDVRQLHVTYLTALTILHKPTSRTSAPSPVAILASSLVAGLFEDFLLRDDCKHLNSIFTFYLLVAGFAQRSCQRYSNLQEKAVEELRIITFALSDMSKKWDSAIGPLKIIQGFLDETDFDAASSTFPPQTLNSDQLIFFAPYGPDFCRKWDLILSPPTQSTRDPTVGHHGGMDASIPSIRDLSDLAPLESPEQVSLDFDFTSYGLFQDLNITNGNALE